MGRIPWPEFLLFELLFTIVLYPTRNHIYRVPVLAALTYAAVQFFLEPEAVVVAYALGGRIVQRFSFTAYLLLIEGPFPDHWRRVRDEVHAEADPDGLNILPSNFPFTKKLWWMLDLAYNFRMIGLVQEPRDCLPPHPPPSRLTFLWKTFLKFILNSAVLDLTSLVFTQSLAFDSRVHDPTDGPETYLAAVPLLYRVSYVLAYCVKLGAGAALIHNIVALICVGLGGSDPTLWPDFWGNWGDSYTVRKFWGRTWHQMLRPTLSGWGKFVSNRLLKFPHGTNLSSYTQLYFGFFLSGIMHLLSDHALEKRIVSRSVKFFALQAVAITFEDMAIYIAKRLSLFQEMKLASGKAEGIWVKAVARAIGYCWVILWLCFSLPIWQDGLSVIGFNNTDRGPVAQFVWDTWVRWV